MVILKSILILILLLISLVIFNIFLNNHCLIIIPLIISYQFDFYFRLSMGLIMGFLLLFKGYVGRGYSMDDRDPKKSPEILPSGDTQKLWNIHHFYSWVNQKKLSTPWLQELFVCLEGSPVVFFSVIFSRNPIIPSTGPYRTQGSTVSKRERSSSHLTDNWV